MLIPIALSNLVLDETLRSPVVVLIEEGGARNIRAPLAPLEANALAMAHAGQDTAESYPSDLSFNLLRSFNAVIDRVVIFSVSEGTIGARLEISCGESRHLVDCRIADGLILSVRNQCGLFAEDSTFVSEDDSETARLKKRISETDTMAFGSLTLS